MKTPLDQRHRRHRAKMADFAGWELPIVYTSIKAEHRAVRTACGVFDVLHMGQIETSGPDAIALLQRLLSNDVTRVEVGGAQYSVLCAEDGGVLDDLFTYRVASDRFLTVTNAANHGTDLAWFRRHAAGLDLSVHDRHRDWAMVAVQGPSARDAVSAISEGPLPPRMSTADVSVAGRRAMVCGTGYTGEDGVEILMSADDSGAVWDALIEAGVTPAGLGARDTLRLEACFHLYGNDLSLKRDPISAGLGWCCREETGFIGSHAVAQIRESGPGEKLVPFVVDAPAIARAGNTVIGGGVVTSGSVSPSLGMGVGMAYLPAASTAKDTRFQIDVRGRIRDATVVARPIYRKDCQA